MNSERKNFFAENGHANGRIYLEPNSLSRTMKKWAIQSAKR